MLENYPVDLLTEAVKEGLEQQQATWVQTNPVLMQHPEPLKWLPGLFAVSPYILQICRRYPEALTNLLTTNALESDAMTRSVDDLQNWILSTAVERGDATSEAVQLSALRRCRHQELLRILWRDFTGKASVDSTLEALSAMADASIRVAATWAHQAMSARFGEARDTQGKAQHLIVLGMGKLGGKELNVSSDIDLIYCYRESGSTDGDRHIDNADFFRRVAQRLTKLLGSVSEDGFVFRVDTRLRPFGESGPLVMNFDGLEHYYVTQGRDWERYAMIKARPIAGDVDAYEELMSMIKPFIYRRYLDYSAIESLRELKHKIALSVKQKNLHNNIKLGAGGIREIEFIGQAFQLVRGGREPRLQIRSIKSVLKLLAELEFMSATDVADLLDAYDHLRRVENALQAMRDKQLHSLPIDEEDRVRLCVMLGYTKWANFEQELQRHQQNVTRCFEALFVEVPNEHSEQSQPSSAYDAWSLLSSPESDEEVRTEALRALGIAANEVLLETLAGLTCGAFYQRLTARAQARVDLILPRLLEAVIPLNHAEQALLRCAGLVRAVAGRSGYLQVLIERPLVLTRLVRLFDHSSWIATFVTRHPIVIDELLGQSAHAALPDRDTIYADAMSEATRFAESELDEQMDAMRHFQQARTLRIAAAEIDGEATLMQVSDQLTWLAEAVIRAVFFLVEKPLQARHGRPCCKLDGKVYLPGVGVIAYGKLGGIELGYGSDLDLVFLHDSKGDAQHTDGDKSISNAQYYARLAQKIVHFMNTSTPAGQLYEIDLRLRPNGQSGVLVTGLEAFARYQQEEAWTWEHQALMRARMVMGTPAVADNFAQLRLRVLCKDRDPDTLRQQVADMRQRMRDSLGSQKTGWMHLKQDAGGVADIEFLVQYLVLANAARHPALAEYTDNVRVLEAVADSGLLSAEDCLSLTEHYLTLRAMIHRQALQQLTAQVESTTELDQLRQHVTGLWQRLFCTHTSKTITD